MVRVLQQQDVQGLHSVQNKAASSALNQKIRGRVACHTEFLVPESSYLRRFDRSFYWIHENLLHPNPTAF